MFEVFRCLHHLLATNHSILEAHLPTIFNKLVLVQDSEKKVMKLINLITHFVIFFIKEDLLVSMCYGEVDCLIPFIRRILKLD